MGPISRTARSRRGRRPERIPAIILCGGMGMRLREETEYRPKPMVEIGGRPILWHIMKLYAAHGFTDFILCLGYKGEAIKEYFLNYATMHNDCTIKLGVPDSLRFHNNHLEHGWTVTLANTGLGAMTGSRIKQVERYVDGGEFLLTYGDGVADVNVRDVLAFHRRHGKAGTVVGVRPPSRFGELVTERDLVVEFSEKPQASQGFINGGFFVFQRRFFEYLSADPQCVLEREPLERLAKEGQLVRYAHHGFWQCMDTPRDVRLLESLWESGNPPWKVWADDAAAQSARRLGTRGQTVQHSTEEGAVVQSPRPSTQSQLVKRVS